MNQSRVYAYLRASTSDQDANRAKNQLIKFAEQQGKTISKFFAENVSGASLKRPQLFELIDTADKGDILLIEQVDRLTRLSNEDWKKLRGLISSKGIRIVSPELPASHTMINNTDNFTASMMDAVNDMLLDMLAAISRKDYEDRRRRQAEGIAKAKSEGRYKGRPSDSNKAAKIKRFLISGLSYSQIQEDLGVSRATIAKVSKQMKLDSRQTH